jgi:ABC-type uncharacterized transport system ATPase component
VQNFIHVDDQSKEVALNAIVAGHNARTKYTENSATSAATASAASLNGASNCTLNMTGTLGAGAALTLPTVSAYLAVATGMIVGETRRIRIMNTSSANYAWTVTTASGWTLVGTMTVAQNAWRDFDMYYSAAGAMTLTNVGGGTV